MRIRLTNFVFHSFTPMESAMKSAANSFRCAAVCKTQIELKACKSSAKRTPSSFTPAMQMMTNVKGQCPGQTRSPLIWTKQIRKPITESIMRAIQKSTNYKNPPTSSSSTCRLTSSTSEISKRRRYRSRQRIRLPRYRNQWFLSKSKYQSHQRRILLKNFWLRRPRNKKYLHQEVEVEVDQIVDQARVKSNLLADKLAHQFRKMCEEWLQFWRSPNFSACRI